MTYVWNGRKGGVFWPAFLKRTILLTLKIFTNRHKDGKKYTSNQESEKKENFHNSCLAEIDCGHCTHFTPSPDERLRKLQICKTNSCLSSLFNQCEFPQIDFEMFIYLFFQELLLVHLKQRLLPPQLQG